MKNALSPSVIVVMLVTLSSSALVACRGPENSRVDDPAPRDRGPLVVAGLSMPESALHDPIADVYLVSNLVGSAAAIDHDGFISRIAPDGRVLALRFIDGKSVPDGLSAPKGMALVGRTLYVTDVDRVRAYDADTGAPTATIDVPEATFLNDAAAAADGTVFVTDSAIAGGDLDAPLSDADAVFAIHGGRARRVAHGPELGHPNGIVVREGKLEIVTLRTGEWLTLDPSGAIAARTKLPGGVLDGLVVLDDGSLVASSWETSSLYRLGRDRTVRVEVAGLESAADIAYDAKRRRLLVPRMMRDELFILPEREAGSATALRSSTSQGAN